MLQKTQILILNTVKYSDNGLIVKGFTRAFGSKSYFVKSLSNGKTGKFKKAFFQPLSQLEIVAKHNNKGNLNYLKEVKVIYPYQELYTDPVKQSLTLFLSEVLYYTVQEEHADTPFFDFLIHAFQQLDVAEKIGNFHLAILTYIIRNMGVMPILTAPKPYFDLVEGQYTDTPGSGMVIEGVVLQQFDSLMTANFQDILKMPLSRQVRRDLLDVIMQYISLHITQFKTPKSMEVIEQLFT
jgi:DNA repair protein RecO (recombination protein O)